MPEWGWSTLSLPCRHAGLLERCSSKSLVGNTCVGFQLSTLACPFLKRFHCIALHEVSAAKSMRFDNVIQGLCCFPCTLLYFHNSIRRAMGAGRMDPLANCCWVAKWNKTGPHPELPSNWPERSRGWITSKFFPSVVRWLWAEGFSFSEVFILSAAPGVCWRSMPKLWMSRRINSWRCMWIGYQDRSDLDPIHLRRNT